MGSGGCGSRTSTRDSGNQRVRTASSSGRRREYPQRRRPLFSSVIARQPTLAPTKLGMMTARGAGGGGHPSAAGVPGQAGRERGSKRARGRGDWCRNPGCPHLILSGICHFVSAGIATGISRTDIATFVMLRHLFAAFCYFREISILLFPK